MTLTVAPDLSVHVYPVIKTLNGEVETPVSTNVWFPVPGGTVLPSAPEVTVNSVFVPVNSIQAPSWFDPDNVDLEQLFNDLVPNNVTAIYPLELDTDILVPGQAEIVSVACTLRCVRNVYTAAYSLTPQITEVTLTTYLTSESLYFIEAAESAYIVQGKAATLSKITDPRSAAGTFSIEGQNAAFKLSLIRLSGDQGSFYVETPRTVSIFRAEGTYLDELEESDLILEPDTLVNLDYSTYKFGSSAFYVFDGALAIVRRAGSNPINSGNPFTLSFWFKPSVTVPLNSARSLIGLTHTAGVFLIQTADGAKLSYGLLSPELPGTYYIYDSNYFLPILESSVYLYENFYHIAVEIVDNQLYLYVNGQVAGSTSAPAVSISENSAISLYSMIAGIDNGQVLSIENGMRSISGYIDDVTLDNCARYKGQSFTPPTLPATLVKTVQLKYLKLLQTAPGNFNITGFTADLDALSKSLQVAGASYTASGESISFKRSARRIPLDNATFVLAGSELKTSPYIVAENFTTFNYPGDTSTFTLQEFTLPNYELKDIAIFVVETSGSAPIYPSIGGWTALEGSPIIDIASTAGSRLYIWWRRLITLNESNITLPIQDHAAAAIFLVRGAAETSTPIAASAVSSTTIASTSVTAPSLEYEYPLTRVVTIIGRPNDSASTTSFSNPVNTSLTNIVEHFEVGTLSNNGGGLVVYSGERLPSGSVNGTIVTKSTSTTSTAAAIAFKTDLSLTPPTTPPPTLTADVGVFNFEGQNTGLITSRILKANEGSVTFNGQSLTFKVAVIFDADLGSYSLNGQSAEFIYNKVLSSDAGSIILNGQDATLTYTPAIGSLEDQFELTALLEDDLLSLDF